MKIVNIKSLAALFMGTVSLFAVASCGGNAEDAKDTAKVDTVKVEVPVKKTREELIVNRDTIAIANPDSITELENKHSAAVTFGEKNAEGKTAVTVKVGENGLVHPAEEEHFIDFIAIYAKVKGVDTELGRVELQNDLKPAEATFTVDLKGVKEVTTFVGCNIHGIWKETTKVGKTK